ncbi:MAG TPA: hypothetical protein PKO09_01250 [Anaerolineae bacterium]|nr:hypothetical protein [Anaerolineae bacterium]
MPGWIRPTIDTKFHIDFAWFDQTGMSFRVFLLGNLCTECRGQLTDYRLADLIDWVDADTGEVTKVDGLWHSLRTCCSLKPDYVDAQTPTLAAVSRILLANGNEPLSPRELSEKLHRTPEAILRTIGGPQVHNGIRPYRPK